MKKIRAFVQTICRHLNGDAAYENYLARLCSKEKALDKKTFLKNRQNNKWRGVNRCC